MLDGLSHRGESGEVHDGFDLVFGEDLFQNGSVANVTLVEIGRNHRVAETAGQIVKHGYLVTFRHKTFHTMTANVAGSTGKKDHIFSKDVVSSVSMLK